MGAEKEIDLDYNHAIQQARRLDEIAAHLKGSVTECLETAAGQLAGGWKGDSGALYIQKLTARQESLTETVSGIRKIAKMIREEAKEIRRQEMMSLGKK